MNYYEAREVKGDDGESTGVWHFTCRNDGRIWPVGCTTGCAHATAIEACQHYAETEIERGVRHGTCSWTKCDAPECDAPARACLAVGSENGGHFYLCEDHATDELAVELYRNAHAGEFSMASSW